MFRAKVRANVALEFHHRLEQLVLLVPIQEGIHNGVGTQVIGNHATEEPRLVIILLRNNTALWLGIFGVSIIVIIIITLAFRVLHVCRLHHVQ